MLKRIIMFLLSLLIPVVSYSQTIYNFEDKPAASKKNPYNGMGSHVLKASTNNLSKQPLLTQADFSNDNTVYVIKYDYKLASNITIPDGCVLQFNGGSIAGDYKLFGTNTCINANLVKIFGEGVKLGGTWNVRESYPEWFGAKGDGVTDDKKAIQRVLDYFDNVYFSAKKYFINAEKRDYVFLINHPISIEGVFEKSEIQFSNLNMETTCFQLENDFVKIENIFLKGDSKQYKGIAIKHINPIRKASYGRSLHMTNVKIWYFYNGIIANSYLDSYKWVECAHCVNGFYLGTEANVDMTSNTLICCYARDCSGIGYNFNRLIYSTIISCAADNCSTAYKLNASENLSFISCGCENSQQAFLIRSCFNIGIHNQRIYNGEVLNERIYNKLIDIATCWEVTFYSLQRSSNRINRKNKYITVGKSAQKDVPCVRFAYCHDPYLNISEAIINKNNSTFNNYELLLCGVNNNYEDEILSNTVAPTRYSTIRPDTSGLRIGYCFFDTVLNKPIYWTGDITKGDKGWVDALGNKP